MKLRRVALVFTLVLLVLAVTSGPPPGAAPRGPRTAEYVPGELLIKFRTNAQALDRIRVQQALGAETKHRFLSSAESWRLGSNVDVEQALSMLKANPLVQYAEPNYIAHTNVVPNDPRFSEMWGLNNTGQTGGTPDADIDAPEAWGVSTGSTAFVIADIDTGCDYNHPDLAANVWTNPGEIPGNGIDDDGNGFVDDVHGYNFVANTGDPFDDAGHGSHTFGTIGAVGNNGIGVTGVMWTARIMCVKFLNSGGSGTYEAAVQSVDYVTQMGAAFSSNSWGGTGYSQALYDAIANANAHGIGFVAAAGNNYADSDVSPAYPAAFDLPNIISVAATDKNDLKADFSNWGLTTVDLGAPGVDVLSTEPGATYGLLSGTSMATPHVAGVCGLIKSVNPNIPWSQLKQVLLNSVDHIPSMAGRTVTGGRLNAFFAIATPDTVPPGQIANLGTTDPGSNTMGLTWTATGDDGNVGTANAYEVRYSLAPIDNTNWPSATRAGNEPTPGVAGSPQKMEVRNLLTNTIYYFAIKAFDEWGNPGPLSNIAVASTLPPPIGQVAPTSVSDDLFTGQQSDHIVMLTNIGPGTLDFTIPSPNIGQPYSVPQEPLILGKDDPDPRHNDPVTEATGGPDSFGYRWVDSDEPGGPTFNWTDISSTGTPVNANTDDSNSGAVPLGFNFPFYGTLFNSINICSNGWLSFTSTLTSYSNQPLPGTGGPENLVAPFWDDLNPGGATHIYFQSFGNMAIVQWNNLPHYSSGGPYTFQAILDSTGAITFQYLTMAAPLDSATVGIQDASRTVGLQMAFNQAYLHDNLAIRISSIPQWLTASPNSGRLHAGESREITVHMDASGLEGGHYPGSVNILTNDPINPTLVVDALLHVVGAPQAFVQPDVLSYGVVFQGQPNHQTLTVNNLGTDTLFVTDVTPSVGELNPSPRVFSVSPHASQNVDVIWTPSALGPFNGMLTVVSNDSSHPSIDVPVMGNGVAAPIMIVNPTSFAETLFTGHQVVRPLLVTNTGGSDLVMTAGADLGGGQVVYTSDVDADGSGGPDGFGYKWKDSDASGGPAFNFIDISGTGTQLSFTSSDDGYSTTNPSMGMTFPFYGSNFTSVRVYSNGFLSFDTTDTSSRLSEYRLPSTNGAKFMLALLWDDLHIRSGNVKYQNTGNCFIVQYTNVEKYSPSGFPMTFQVQLYPNGKILYMYKTMPTGGTYNSLSIGIQDGTKTVGLSANYDANYVHANMAIQFSRTPDWLSVTPAGATIHPGDSFTFNVTFDSTDRGSGTLHGNVVLDTNIPSQAHQLVPAALTVIGAPVVGIVPTSFNYGTHFTGYPYLTTIQVVNNGTDNLNVSELHTSDPTLVVLESTAQGDAIIPEAGFSLTPGASRQFQLQWSPVVPGTLNALVHVISDDPATPDKTMPVTGVAIPPPVADWSPPAFNPPPANVGDVILDTLHLQNDGLSDLTFNTAIQLNSGVAVTVYEPLELKKEEADPRIGILGMGGPDNYGYHWRDSDQEGGPAFDWAEISGVGTVIPALDNQDDYTSAGNPLGFTFPFYGHNFSYVNICSNGWVSFSSTSTSYSNQPLPNTGAPENFLAGFWDDLHTRTGHVYTYNDGARFIVEFKDVQRLSTGSLFTFEFILYPNGRVVYQYLTMSGTLNDATIGTQNATMNDGLLVAYNTAYMHDGLAIQFEPPFVYPSVTPVSGVIPPGGAIDLAVRIDTTGLIGGDYHSTIDITTNDPAHSFIQVPVSVHVTGVPDIMATPTSLTFPMTYVGFTRSATFKVTNTGTDFLHISDVQASGDFLVSGMTTPATLAVGASTTMTVTFAPTTDGVRTGAVTFLSDDPDEASFAVGLEGFALFPPEIHVTPAAISTSLPPAGTRTKTLTVCNTGRSDLVWNGSTNILSAQGGPSPNYGTLELGKNDVDPRPGILGSGGPDGFGYTWIDSDAAGGPVFDWVDISGVGTPITSWGTYCDDCNSGAIPIGFPFNFYGNSFSNVYVNTNGWVSFTSALAGYPSYSNQPLPTGSSAAYPENLLAAFWDDLAFRGTNTPASAAYYYNDGTRFIVQFTHWYRLASTTDDLNFEVIIYPSGTILYQFETMSSSTLNSATIGIQNAAKDIGLMTVFDNNYVHGNMAIKFSRFPEWVKLSPLTGTIPAGACTDVTAFLNAAGLELGLHDALITFTSNDPYTPLVTVPVTLDVSVVSTTWNEFSPDVLNLSSNGNYVKMCTQLPTDLDPHAIRLSSVMLNDAVPALMMPPPDYGDVNNDGITDVCFKFDRAAVEATLTVGQSVPVYIQGEIGEDGQWWRGFDTIRTMNPSVKTPLAGATYRLGTDILITWDPPVGGSVDHYIVQLTRDGGATWEQLADSVQGTSYTWTSTGANTRDARIRVLAMDNQGVMGYDWNDGAFSMLYTPRVIKSTPTNPNTINPSRTGPSTNRQ